MGDENFSYVNLLRIITLVNASSVFFEAKLKFGHLKVDPQSGLFSYFSFEERIPADHPLRRLKAQADELLGSMRGAV